LTKSTRYRKKTDIGNGWEGAIEKRKIAKEGTSGTRKTGRYGQRRSLEQGETALWALRFSHPGLGLGPHPLKKRTRSMKKKGHKKTRKIKPKSWESILHSLRKERYRVPAVTKRATEGGNCRENTIQQRENLTLREKRQGACLSIREKLQTYQRSAARNSHGGPNTEEKRAENPRRGEGTP